jgi:hypothetical protein
MGHRKHMATELLKRAFEELAKLPEFEQDALAETLLALVSSDAGWDDLLAKSQDKLARLADRALQAEDRDLEPLDPDKL